MDNRQPAGSGRNTILDLFSGKKIDTQPAFSGLIHVTLEGVQVEGLTLHEAHHDAQKMAKAAASTYRLTGIPSAALPLDLCAPAEALGAQLNFYEGAENQFPQPAKPLFGSTAYLNSGSMASEDFLNQGRIPLICRGLEILKEEIGSEAILSAIIPGPYTLLLYLVEAGGLFAEMKREPNLVQDALFHLSSFLTHLAQAYRSAGADLITIHDMGGSPGFIGPAKFEQFVFPALKQLISGMPGPAVLSVCGNTNKSMHLLAETGADAISVDQTNDLEASRTILKDTLLFGNMDPVRTLWQGNEAAIREAVHEAKAAGADAIWPGCDLVQQTPLVNIRAWIHPS
jgi:MtaA/CmuA family methyltransferase